MSIMNSKKLDLLLKLPLSLALCVTAFLYIEAHYLAPKLNPEQVEQTLSILTPREFGSISTAPVIL